MDTKSAKPESPQGKENKSLTNNKAIGRRSVMLLAAMCLFSVFAFVSPVAAADVTNSTVDWNGLGTMISGAAGLFPSITTLIMAVIPILILLIIVGFITGLFDSIIQAVRGAISFMK